MPRKINKYYAYNAKKEKWVSYHGCFDYHEYAANPEYAAPVESKNDSKNLIYLNADEINNLWNVIKKSFRHSHKLKCKLVVSSFNSAQQYSEMYTLIDTYQLCTYDFDFLTRLVIHAHDNSVRVGLGNGGPNKTKIYLSSRKREGRMHERHPTLEHAVQVIRGEE